MSPGEGAGSVEGSCLHLVVARVEPAVTAAEHGVRHDRTRLLVREVGRALVEGL